ncbi:hypothetical protein MCOR27_002393 [Pyricularia oryzae]|nr:hypothetical protein MCOR01_004112 [Pyricularia oryzae]KAI6259215.1 hypothetical protein MCOR19_004436 [Pyricularia oryzae]KAI6285250.1 hypothetical protein MCOR27_002393 [Pyricularia oryzae]KAI6325906.1 hypothetical protein MCOR29_003612 [Pyricularia oryzae]KAI6407881.1 hypothetical protein MCOR20_005632 [Pyricularia oryzae]
MTSSISSETQLLAEHFGYPPVSLLDDIINSINILAEQALNSVERGLLAAKPTSLGFRAPPPQSKKTKHSATTTVEDAPPPSPEEVQRHEVENGTHQLETLLCASIDRNFDIFEIWVMRNILTVRPDDRDWIRLSHYEGLDFSAASKRMKLAGTETGQDEAVNADGPEGDKEPSNQTGAGGEGEDVDAAETAGDAPTLASVARLRRRLQASQKLNVMLHAERARNAKLLDELRQFIHGTPGPAAVKVENEEGQNKPNLAFLRSKGDLTVGDAETPLTTTTAFSLSQLQALRALSTSLRTMMPDLVQRTGGADQGDTKKSWRTERLEYVEGSTRRHLENVRGLELGASGYVRDGEWQGEGRSLATGEVQGLERIASLLGAEPKNSVREPETRTADAMDEP